MFQNVTMDQFADKLEGISAWLSTPVINATNLEGSYDFTINYSGVGARWTRRSGHKWRSPRQTGREERS